MEKKSERLEVRLGYQEKQNFTDACDMQGDTPSSAIRRFINGYVRRSDNDVLTTMWRRSAKRKIVPVILLSGIFVLCASGIYWAVKATSGPSSSEIFAFRDVNGDGQLEYSEHGVPPALGGQPNGVMRVLDLDASGTISRAEFVHKGRMVYMLESDRPGEQIDKKYPANLVEFNFSKHRSKTGTYEGATINADELDRLAIWPLDGPPTIMEGRVMISSGLEEIEFRADIVTTPAQQK